MISNPLIEQIIETASGDLLVAIFAKAFRGYSRESLNIPISHFYVSFTPEEMKVSYFDDELTGTCKKTELVLRMTVYAPAIRKGSAVHSIAEVIADFLTDAYIGEMKGYTIGDLSYDDGVNALTLPSSLRFEFNECPLGNEDGDVSATIPDSFFCKSHVSNPDVHITAADRTYLNEPFVIGTYTGDGASAGKDIELGFRPKAVIIYRNSYHISSYSAGDGISNCYMGMAIGSSYTRGPLILDNGFRVKTVVTSSATTHLNDEGGAYTYIAFR